MSNPQEDWLRTKLSYIYSASEIENNVILQKMYDEDIKHKRILFILRKIEFFLIGFLIVLLTLICIHF